MVMIPARSYNQDHEALFHAGVTATRPGCPGTAKRTVPWVLAYDNTSLFWTGDQPRFNPNVFIDITDYSGYQDHRVGDARLAGAGAALPRQPGEPGAGHPAARA